MHAADFLKAKSPPALPPVIALPGSQRHLKQIVLKVLVERIVQGDDAAVTRFASKDLELQTLTDELATVSMWTTQRLVIVEDADEFITKNRSALEKYCEKPARKSVLVLDAKSWPKTTKLAKLIDKTGLEIECSELKGAALSQWILATVRDPYGKSISREAVALLMELVGPELGVLDQELAKLSAYVGTRDQIGAQDVKSLVGGWQTETTWAMTDALREGDIGHALRCLDQLLVSGEAPQKLLGGVNFVFRKLAAAVELSRTMTLPLALQEAGVFARDIQTAEAYLRRIGRAKAERLLRSLLTADSGLKGGSRLPERLLMEELLLKLAGCV